MSFNAKLLALFFAFVVLLGLIAVHEGDEVVADCGGPSVSTPMTIKVMDKVKIMGENIRRLNEGPPKVGEIVAVVFDLRETMMLWWTVLTDSANGRNENDFATGWRLRVAQKQAEELARCCVTLNQPQQPPGATPPPESEQPFDPKTLSISKGNVNLHGKWLAADALIKSGVPYNEVPTFVAIADHESTMGANIENPSNSNVKGWWQMDQRYWQSGDWHNPYDNAKAVKKARDDGMKRFSDPYHHWSTKSAAISDANQYDDLVGAKPKTSLQGPRTPLSVDPFESGQQPPVADSPQQQLPYGCPAGSGELNANVGTWNVLKDNSARNVVAGIKAMRAQGAGVIGLQELGDEGLRAAAAGAAPGMKMTDTNNAVPVLYDENKYTVLSQGQVQALSNNVRVEARAGDHGLVGPKWVTYVHLEDRIDQKRFWVVNTHMLVGPKIGPKRQAAYDRQLQVVLAQVAKFETTGDPVMITGDFNQTEVPAITAAGLTSSLSKSTHGKKSIYDRVWSKGATPTTHQILSKNGSDHNPVLATFVATTKEFGAQLQPLKVVWPVPGHKTGTYPGHDGMDINRGSGNDDAGDPIVSAADGTVTYVGGGRGYGEAIFIKTDTGPYTMIFGHTRAQFVSVGQHVNAGQKIAEVGNTGNSSAAHLHFGVKPGLTFQAAKNFLEGRAAGFEVGGVNSNLQSKPAGSVRGGYTPRAKYIKDITATYWGCKNRPSPCVKTFYGFADKNIAGTNTKSDHASGNAVDIMVDARTNKQMGDAIARYMQANAKTLNIKYIIWNDKIWSQQRRREDWRPGPGGHRNHIHVSVEGGVAA